MNRRDRLRTGIVVAGLVALAAALRYYGLGWGLPEVFEEATPMREAWEMWGWGGRPFDANPHFFNYPSLVIYLQLLGQGLLFLAMKAAGTIASAIDFRTLYETDKTAFVMVARALTAAFGAATVGVTYALVRRVATQWAAALAALLLAVNTVHIANSQMVTVDVPLTFLSVVSLWASLRLLDDPSRRRYLVAGMCVGLAASAKYTGALLAVSVLVAHVMARRARKESAPSWSLAAVAAIAAAAAFLLTSPFVLLDATTFVRHFSIEQYHMQVGHFGLDGPASWRVYAAWLAGDALGWPTLLAGLAGIVYLGAAARRPWAVVIAAFVVVYSVSVGSWSMRAERYVLPVIPILTVFAVALVAELSASRRFSRMNARARAVAVVVVALVLAAPLVAAFPAHFERYQPDPRSRAREWIEANVPAGSFIVTEAYGPHLFGPSAVWQLDDDVRRAVFSARSGRPYYALQEIPMYQVDPERSGVFYDFSVIAMADVIVTTDAVRGRYQRDAARYPRQVSFYRTLENTYDLAAEFPGGSGGFGLRVYRSRSYTRPFARRPDVTAPGPLQAGLPAAPGAQEQFYFRFGINYEAFNHYSAAYQCYETAFRYSVESPLLLADVSMGMARCLDAMGQRARAVELLSRVLAIVPTDEDRSRVRRLHDILAPRQ